MAIVSKNVVVSANKLNLSLINRSWLNEHKILRENEIQGPGIVTPVFQKYDTADLEMLLLEERLQVVLKDGEKQQWDPSGEQTTILQTVGRFVMTLPHTPFTGVGLNIAWNLPAKPDGIHQMSMDLFFNTEGPLAREFSSPDSHYGAYLSKNWQEFRLKLTALPVRETNSGEEFIQLSFNFHKDVAAVSDIKTALLRWNDTCLYTQKIMGDIQLCLL